MARIDELRLITRVARLYHEQGLKQPEIAARLRLSQPKVSRLLRQALDEGIVRITVRVPTGTHPDLEERLQQRFGLEDAVVVDVTPDGDELVARELGTAAAFYLESTVRSGDVIGISSWSATLLAMVDSLDPVPTVRDTKVVQILGGVGDPAAELLDCRCRDVICMQRVSVRSYPARHGKSHLADSDESDRVFTFAGCHFSLSISAKTSLATRIASTAAGMPQ